MTFDVATNIPTIVRILADANVEVAVLFGSMAYGQPRADSDVDIGILVGRRPLPSIRELTDLATAIERAVRHDVDLVVLDDASPLLRHEASRGRLLFESRAGAFADMATRALFELDDVRPYLRRAGLAYIRARRTA